MDKLKQRSLVLIILAIVIFVAIGCTIYFVSKNSNTDYIGKSSTGTINENVKIGNLEISILEIKKIGNAYNTSLRIINDYDNDQTIKSINLKFIDNKGNIISEALAIVEQTIKSKESIIIETNTDADIAATYEIKYTILD